MPNTLYNDAMRSKRYEIKRCREAMGPIRAGRKMLGRLSTVLRAIKRKHPNSGDGWVSIYSGEKISVSFALYGLDGFGGKDVLFALAKLEKLGFEFNKSEDEASNGCRIYTSESGNFKVALFAYLADDSKSCRKVIDRMETREVPVYKMVCS